MYSEIAENVRIHDEYKNRNAHWNGIQFSWCYAKKRNRVITLSPVQFAKCVDGDEIMLLEVDSWFDYLY